MKAAVILMLLGLAGGAATWGLETIYQRGHAAGSAKVRAQWKQQDAERAESTQRTLGTLIARANTLQDQLQQQDTHHHQEQTHAQAEINRLRAALRTGAVRLSVPTSGPACPGPQNAGPAAGPEQARAELDPATADALVAITADGDTAIRELNACIDRYDAVRQTLNAPLPQD